MKATNHIIAKLVISCVFAFVLITHPTSAQTPTYSENQRADAKAKAEETRLFLQQAMEKMIAETKEKQKVRAAKLAELSALGELKSATPSQSSAQYSGPAYGNGQAAVQMVSDGALISWNSSTNQRLYYDIYFRTNLDDTLESWFMLEQGYPTQGTNTIWKDTGYWDLISLPGQDPTRFYKIVGWTNTAPQPVVTTTVPNGTLSGEITINVSITTTAAVLSVRLYVDGARVDEINGAGSFVLNTTNFMDGDHKIFVIAESSTGFESTDEAGSDYDNTTAYGLSTPNVRTFGNGVAANSPKNYTPIPVTNTFGIMFQGDHPSWKDLGPNVNWAGPWNGLNNYVTLANAVITPRPYGKLRSVFRIADGFTVGLGRVGNTPKFFHGNSDMVRNGDLVRSPQWGGASKFNQVNFGFLIGHGVRGLTPDYTTGFPSVKDTYFPLWTYGESHYDWVPLSQCDFGSANLRWMAILSCNNLSEPNLTDLFNKKFSNNLIINEDLHLLLGGGSAIYMVSNFGRVFADACAKGTNGTPMSIREAWFYAGTVTQGINNPNPGVPVIFTVVGYSDCWNDTIYNFSDPNYWDLPVVESRQVYP